MKKAIITLLSLALLLSLAMPAAAKNETKTVDIVYNGIRIVVNGRYITPTDARGEAVEPFIISGTTYLPVRAVAGALGLAVKWNAATSTISLLRGVKGETGGEAPASSVGKKTVPAVYRNIKLSVDGKAVTPKDAAGRVVEPFIIDGTTYLPVRAVANALGIEVAWDAETSTVYLGGEFLLYLQSETIFQRSGDWEHETEERYTYNSDGSVATHSYTSPEKRYDRRYVYDGNGSLLSESDALTGVRTTYTYDSLGRKLSSTMLAGLEYEKNEYSYTAAGALAQHTLTSMDLSGRVYKSVTDYVYGARGGVVREETRAGYDGEQEVRTKTYDEYGNTLTEAVDHAAPYTPDSSVSYTYDKNGRVLEIVRKTDDVDFASRAVYAYDKSGNCLSIRNFYGDTPEYSTLFTYDASGRVLTEAYENSSGSIFTKRSYNADGKLLTEKKTTRDAQLPESSTVSAYTYDAKGNLLSETYTRTDPDGSFTDSTAYTYSASGDMLSSRTVTAAGAILSGVYEYDEYGNEISRVSTGSDGSVYSVTREYIMLPA